MTDYEVRLVVNTPLPDMQTLGDIIAEGLKELGYNENGDFELTVTGPPELYIGFRDTM